MVALKTALRLTPADPGRSRYLSQRNRLMVILLDKAKELLQTDLDLLVCRRNPLTCLLYTSILAQVDDQMCTGFSVEEMTIFAQYLERFCENLENSSFIDEKAKID